MSNIQCKLGDSGRGVEVVQLLLNRFTGAKLTVNGKFDANMVTAVKRYQAMKKISGTGNVGPKTAAALLATGIPPLTLQQFRGCMKNISEAAATGWHSEMSSAMFSSELNTLGRIAGFLAQIAVESGCLTRLVENMNYSAAALARTWPTRYATGGRPNSLAVSHANRPSVIGNYVYANRMGNGPVESGDGYRYRGHGPISITGADMMRQCGAALKVDLLANPTLLTLPRQGSRSAVWYWMLCDLNEHADSGDFDKICDEINIGRETVAIGDSIGYVERLSAYYDALIALSK